MRTHAEDTCFAPTSDVGLVDAHVLTERNSPGFAQKVPILITIAEPFVNAIAEPFVNAGTVVISSPKTGGLCVRKRKIPTCVRWTLPVN